MATTWEKPAGLPVFPPHADPDGDCALARLLAAAPWRREIPFPAGFEGGISHRLDNPTSGALLVADSVAELAEIRAAFADKRFDKRYVFQPSRWPSWTENACHQAIAHHPDKRDRMVVQRGANTPHRGRWFPAESWFRRTDPVMSVRITTGVTHQIRAHAAFLGVPLAGDRIYGGGPALSPDIPFRLHHVGLTGAGFTTDPVPRPPWA